MSLKKSLFPNSPTRLGITGGIGSGKSFVCQLLEKQGFPIFYCDDVAKRIIRTHPDVKRDLVELVGADVYSSEGILQKSVLAAYLCQGRSFSSKVDAIVHPRVAEAFRVWCEAQEAPVAFMECALLFESGFQKLVDHTIHVTAPLEVRIERVMKRDGVSKEKVKAWIDLQMPESEKQQLADFSICNDESIPLEPQIMKILADFV